MLMNGHVRHLCLSAANSSIRGVDNPLFIAEGVSEARRLSRLNWMGARRSRLHRRVAALALVAG